MLKRCTELMEWMVKNPEEVLNICKDLDKGMRQRKCIFEGETFKLALLPFFLSSEEKNLIARVSEAFYSITNKIIKASLHDRDLQSYFSYKDIPQEWLDIDKGYEGHAVITRLDALYDGKNLKFLEFNTDNPGGKGWTDIVEEIVFSHSVYRNLFPPAYKGYEKKVVDGLFKAIMNSFNAFWGKEKEPSLGIIEYRESQFRSDAEIVRDYFREKGVRASLVDPRDFEYRGGILTAERMEYNIFLRCVKAQELLDYPEQLKPFISAYINGDMCMVNSFRALLGSEKSILSLICNKKFHHYLTEEETLIIQKHIPWTFRMSDNIVTSRQEETDIREYLIKKQEKFILKPSWGYGGKGVILGKHVSSGEWDEAIKKYGGNENWIAQEYVEVPRIEVPVLKETGKVEVENKYFNLSPYVFGGRYVGCLGRISDSPVINVSAGGGIIPVYAE
jgi:glutathionylspermidine synthase